MPRFFFPPPPRPTMATLDVESLACCLCLGAPAVLPVRPHGDGLASCGCLMCQGCYRRWRDHHGWGTLPPPPAPAAGAPCTTAIGGPTLPRPPAPDVPPDVVLVGLLGGLPVACPACQTDLTMGTLSQHLGSGCSVSTVTWLRDLHAVDRLGSDGFCAAQRRRPPEPGIGPHGAAPACLGPRGCAWAESLLRLWERDPLDPVPWRYLQEEVLPRLVRRNENYLQLRPVQTLLLGVQRHPVLWGRTLRLWEEALVARPPPPALVLSLVAFAPHPALADVVHRQLLDPLLKGGDACGVTLEELAVAPLRTLLRRHPPPGLGEALAHRLPSPAGGLLSAWALDLLEHEVLDLAAGWSEPTWRTWWTAASSRSHARLLLRAQATGWDLLPSLWAWWYEWYGSAGPLPPPDGAPFTWEHALAMQHAGARLPGLSHTLPTVQQANLLLFALCPPPGDAALEAHLRDHLLLPQLRRQSTHRGKAPALPPALVLLSDAPPLAAPGLTPHLVLGWLLDDLDGAAARRAAAPAPLRTSSACTAA